MRIGINVPNDLLKQVKEISPEVNVSQICREALEHRVEAHQKAGAQVDADGTDEHVARLAQSVTGSLIDPDWETYALEDARDWVRAVTPEAWNFFIYQCDFLRRNGRDGLSMVEHWSAQCGAKGINVRLNENQEWFIEQHEVQFESGIGPRPREKVISKYAPVWLGYLLKVRRMIQQHNNEEHEKVMAEREKYRQSLENPDLPAQLI